MGRRRVHALVVLFAALGTGASIANGCAAGGGLNHFTTGAGGAGGAGSDMTGAGASGGGDLEVADAGKDARDDVTANPCGSKCGPEELCDPEHLGLDDNCNGVVDEGCPCSAGSAHACFKGDPSYHNEPGCFDGSEKCTENGFYGSCKGGVHATPPQNCFKNDTSSCHAITAAPFADVSLKAGTGTFSAGADPDNEVWTVACPAGVNPCPAVTGVAPKDRFKPLQSGEYTVTYTKFNPGMGSMSCSYPLFVGTPGLRVELTWEHHLTDTGVDLDLHVHQPDNLHPWGFPNPVREDCHYLNCDIDKFAPVMYGTAPSWFADPPAKPPTPVNWWLDPLESANNTCFSAPRGAGKKWQANNLGCHSPRLDLDNRGCYFSVTDPDSQDFCAPENVNIDFPPSDQWIRIGVNYFLNRGQSYDVHPDVKIFCHGALAAQLGSAGYASPEAPVTFSSADGEAGDPQPPHRFWLVADVAFKVAQCSNTCIVKPLYADKTAKTPYFTTDAAAGLDFAPDYPPPP